MNFGKGMKKHDYLPSPELCGDNPAINTIKRIGKSNLFLIAVILEGFSLILNIYYMSFIYGNNIRLFATVTSTIIFTATVFFGMAVFCESCRSKKYGGVKPSGMRIVRTAKIAELSVMSLSMIFLSIYILINGEDGKLYTEILELINNETGKDISFTYNQFIVFFIISIVIVAAVASLYYVFLLKSLNKIIETIRTGTYCGKLSVGLAVIFILVAISNIINIDYTNFVGLSSAMGAANAAYYIILVILLFRYNNEMDILCYATRGNTFR